MDEFPGSEPKWAGSRSALNSFLLNSVCVHFIPVRSTFPSLSATYSQVTWTGNVILDLLEGDRRNSSFFLVWLTLAFTPASPYHDAEKRSQIVTTIRRSPSVELPHQPCRKAFLGTVGIVRPTFEP